MRSAKVTFGDFAETIFAGMNARPRTLEKHRYHLDAHLLPRFRNRKVGEITTDDVARLISEMETGVHYVTIELRLVRERRKSGYAGWTILGVVSTLGLILGKTKRRGLIPVNPVVDLERSERPKVARAEKRVLDDSQIARLSTRLAHSAAYRSVDLLRTSTRKALDLQWRDVDEGFLHVRRQVGRDRAPAEIKTDAGRRDVVLMPQLASLLTAHRLASLHSLEADYAFRAPDGRGRDHRSTAKGIERAVTRAGLGRGISAHSFRHTFASQLIVGLGLDPVRVSRLLGHTSPAFTASTYAHMFEQARHADELRERMAEGYGHLLAGRGIAAQGS